VKEFQKRLKVVLRKGNLRVADLSRWFDRPHATVAGWVKDGHDPGGGPADIEHAQSMLGLLEGLLEKRTGLPVPRLSPQKRIAHLTSLRETIMNVEL